MGWNRAVRGMMQGGAVVVAAAAVACKPEATPQAAQQQTPAAANVILAAAMVGLPTGVTAADLPEPDSPGAQLTAKFCGQSCHGIPAPSSHSAQDWPVVLRRMWLRMGRLDSATYHIQVPTDPERIVLVEYMLAHALQVSAGALPDAPGKNLFVSKCGACHGLPDIKQHSSEDWAAVVRRMNTRMEKMLGTPLSQDEMQRIVVYLQTATKS
jgi:cytochrome c5